MDVVFTTGWEGEMEDGRRERIGRPGNRYGDGMLFYRGEGRWEKGMS
jgi:hypothetical protein